LIGTNIDDEAARRNDDAESTKKYKRHFERGTPIDALTWKTPRQRTKRMFAWQCALMVRFGASPLILCVGWLLYTLAMKEGAAFATDGWMAETLGMERKHIQAALTDLEWAGAIVRASRFVDGRPQRRIWPSNKIIPPATGDGYSSWQ
jgi:hypothetical protein